MEGTPAAAAGPGPDREREVRHFIEELSMVLARMGFPPMPARVWVAALVADGDTVTAGEIGARLGVSPAAVSGAVQYLLQLQLLSRVAMPGSRRQHYRADTDQWADVFLARQRQFDEFNTVAGSGIALMGAQSPAGARLTDFQDFFGFVGSEMTKLVQEWSARQAQR